MLLISSSGIDRQLSIERTFTCALLSLSLPTPYCCQDATTNAAVLTILFCHTGVKCYGAGARELSTKISDFPSPERPLAVNGLSVAARKAVELDSPKRDSSDFTGCRIPLA
jgi:hypothetical protein